MSNGGGRRAGVVLDAAVGVGLVVAVAVTFVPWLRSGEARRDSHQLVRAAERLDVFEGGAAVAVRVGWAVLPLVAALGVLALVRGWRRTGLAAGVAVGVTLLVVGFGLTRAGELADWGATAAMVVGGVLAVAGTAGLVTGRHEGMSDERRHPAPE